MSKRTKQALVAVRMCRSFRGHDFDVVNGSRSSVGAYAKEVTTRAERRLNSAIEDEELEEATLFAGFEEGDLSGSDPSEAW